MLTRDALITRRAELLAHGEQATQAIAQAQQRLLLVQGALAEIERWLALPDDTPAPVEQDGA